MHLTEFLLYVLLVIIWTLLKFLKSFSIVSSETYSLQNFYTLPMIYFCSLSSLNSWVYQNSSTPHPRFIKLGIIRFPWLALVDLESAICLISPLIFGYIIGHMSLCIPQHSVAYEVLWHPRIPLRTNLMIGLGVALFWVEAVFISVIILFKSVITASRMSRKFVHPFRAIAFQLSLSVINFSLSFIA